MVDHSQRHQLLLRLRMLRWFVWRNPTISMLWYAFHDVYNYAFTERNLAC
jgi:hypothetical protein